MLTTLNLAKTNGDRVNLLLSNGEFVSRVLINSVDENQVGYRDNNRQTVIYTQNIDVIFVYKNSTTHDTLISWIENGESLPDGALDKAFSNTFILDIVFKSGHNLTTSILGFLASEFSDFAYVGEADTDDNLIAIFVTNNVFSYQYQNKQGLPTATNPPANATGNQAETIRTITIDETGLLLDDASDSIQNIINPMTTAGVVRISGSIHKKFTIICTSDSNQNLEIRKNRTAQDVTPGHSVTFIFDGTNWVEISNSIVNTSSGGGSRS